MERRLNVLTLVMLSEYSRALGSSSANRYVEQGGGRGGMRLAHPLDQDSPQRVGHEDNGTPRGIFVLHVLPSAILVPANPPRGPRSTHETFGVQGGDQGLGVLVDVVARGALPAKGVDVRIISVHQDAGLRTPQGPWEQLGRPEDSVLRRPRISRMTVQAMDKDDAGRAVNIGSLAPAPAPVTIQGWLTPPGDLRHRTPRTARDG